MGALANLALRRFSVPSIVAYLGAGLIIGPYLPVPVFADADRLHALSDFGVVLVMFAVGLELRLRRLIEVLPASGFTGLLQMGTLWWVGMSLGQRLGWTYTEALFLGGCLAVSSTMVVSKVLEQHPVAPAVRRHVFGVLVLQDVAAATLITLYTALASGAGLEPIGFAKLLGGLLAALVGMLAGGMLFVPRLVRAVVAEGQAERLVITAAAICFGFAVLADALGYSVALGAFVAGVLVAESGRAHEVDRALAPLKDVFTAVFFVSVGMTVDPRLVLEQIVPILIISAAVIGAQLVSVSGAGLLSGLGIRRSLLAGLTLGQIGEFAFVIASIGTSAGVVSPALGAVVVAVAVVTAFTTPQLVSRGDRLVRGLDHILPRPVRSALALHEAWLDRMRTSGQDTGVRRAIRSLGIDVLLLVSLVTAASLLAPWAAEALGERVTLAEWQMSWFLRIALLIAVAPIVAITVRNARVLASALAARVPVEPGTPAPVLASLQLASLLLVWVGVALPTFALLRPVLRGPFGPALLLSVAAGLAVAVVRTLRGKDEDVRSATARLVEVLARDSAPEDVAPAEGPPLIHEPGWLPATEELRQVRIPPDAAAVGCTLAELDLRARTGATVVVILTEDGRRHALPSGHARLEAGQVVVLMGAEDADEDAQVLLTTPRRGDPPPSPPAAG